MAILDGSNIIETGNGNDIIELNGLVSGALQINAGVGNDLLVLHASDSLQFNVNYRGWLTDIADKGELGLMSVETIRIDMGPNGSLDQVDWLTRMIDQHNQLNPNTHIDLEIIGHNNPAFSFDDLFPQAGGNVIPGLGSNDNGAPHHNGGLSAFNDSNIFSYAFNNHTDDILAQAGLNAAVV